MANIIIAWQVGIDWAYSGGYLVAAPLSRFSTLLDWSDTGYGVLNTTDNGNGGFLATAGTLTVTGGLDVGSIRCIPVGQDKPQAPAGSSSSTIFSTPQWARG